MNDFEDPEFKRSEVAELKAKLAASEATVAALEKLIGIEVLWPDGRTGLEPIRNVPSHVERFDLKITGVRLWPGVSNARIERTEARVAALEKQIKSYEDQEMGVSSDCMAHSEAAAARARVEERERIARLAESSPHWRLFGAKIRRLESELKLESCLGPEPTRGE